jgi:hypothetical protein
MVPIQEMLAFLFFGLFIMVVPPVVCDADFMSVRTTMSTDYSGKRGDPAAKYFRESGPLALSVSRRDLQFKALRLLNVRALTKN